MFEQIEIEAGGRDPRVDPIPGDIVARQMKKGIAFREVTARSGRRVRYSWEGATNGMRWADGLHVSGWSTWCRKAVVIRREQG